MFLRLSFLERRVLWHLTEVRRKNRVRGIPDNAAGASQTSPVLNSLNGREWDTSDQSLKLASTTHQMQVNCWQLRVKLSGHLPLWWTEKTHNRKTHLLRLDC